jgi:hypothetical protein
LGKLQGTKLCPVLIVGAEILLLSLEDIISSPVISVLQLGSECLDSFEWKVIGIDKKQAPLMHRGERSYSAGILSNLAEAYYGLEPWNLFSHKGGRSIPRRLH